MSLFVFAVLAVSLIEKIIFTANMLPYFVDELVNIEAAFTFFTQGNYSSAILIGPFPPSISTGIAGTWPAGIVWFLGGSIFTSRLVLSFWIILQLVILTDSFMRFHCGKDVSIQTRLWACLVVVFGICNLPYWFGFMYNLGELQGALLVGWALFFLARQRIFLTFLLLGIVVWLCKFIYFPYALLIGTASLLSQPGLKERLRFVLIFCLAFLLPLALWNLVILIKFHIVGLMQWYHSMTGFIYGGASGFNKPIALSLMERFKQLEWHFWSYKDKLEIIILLVVTTIAYLKCLLYNKKERPKLLLETVMFIAILGHTVWFFTISPWMWIRHFIPVLYFCFGFIGYTFIPMFIKMIRTNGFRARPIKFIIILAIAILSIFEFRHEWRRGGAFKFQKMTFARICKATDMEKCTEGQK